MGSPEGSEIDPNETGGGSLELKELGFHGLAKIASSHSSRISVTPVGKKRSQKSSHGFTLCCDGDQQKMSRPWCWSCWDWQSHRRNPPQCLYVPGSSQVGSSLISPGTCPLCRTGAGVPTLMAAVLVGTWVEVGAPGPRAIRSLSWAHPGQHLHATSQVLPAGSWGLVFPTCTADVGVQGGAVPSLDTTTGVSAVTRCRCSSGPSKEGLL